MNNINDLKDLMRELEEAFYSGSQIPIDCVNYIKEWLKLNDEEEYNTKDWKAESEYYKSECEDLQNKCEDLQNKCEYYKSECEDLESKCEYWKNQCKKLNVGKDSYKALLDMVTEEKNEYTNIRKSFINSLIQTNTLVSGKKTYLIYDDITQKFKIGKSYDPYKREKTLCSDRCSINLVAYCDYDIESVLHSMYSEYRVRGEWFNLSTNQVHCIIKYFGMKVTNQTKLNEFYYTDLEPFLNPKY